MSQESTEAALILALQRRVQELELELKAPRQIAKEYDSLRDQVCDLQLAYSDEISQCQLCKLWHNTQSMGEVVFACCDKACCDNCLDSMTPTGPCVQCEREEERLDCPFCGRETCYACNERALWTQ